MPKKPEIDCPLRKLRLITGKSQVEFAKVLGCSPSTIKKIEAGDNSKLNMDLLLAASIVFGVIPNSLIPPSTQPIKLMDGKPYTKRFFKKWWNSPPGQMEPERQKNKAWMLRELEMLLAAAIRLPGMRFNAVFSSFISWTKEAMINFDLPTHYEAEWKERVKKAQKKPNKIQADWELVNLFVKNKSKFLQEAFEADVSPTMFCPDFLESQKDYVKEKVVKDWKKKSKAERLKLMVDLTSEGAQKGFQAGTLEGAFTTSGPKRTR